MANASPLESTTVTSTPSNYPRLHLEESSESQRPAQAAPDSWSALCEAFQLATGWSLLRPTDATPRQSSRLLAGTVKPAADGGAAKPVTVDVARAERLAEAITDLWLELQRAREEIWRREADLAVGVPVARHRREEEHLAVRLEAILRGAAVTSDCQAAGLYLLDEATTELKLRASWGLPKERLIAPARPLNGAMADLEALVGHAVALEDARLLPHWKIPEPYPAGLCVPVSSPTDPLGTLWLFSEQPREFTDQQTHLAEIISGRIAAELQREVLLSECLAARQIDRQLLHAAQWQRDHLPTVAPLVEGWQLAGWTTDEDGLLAGFYDWFVRCDGMLAVSFGICDGLAVESALSAAALQASQRAHADRGLDAATMIRRLNEDVWTASAGGHFSSLLHAVLEPEAPALQFALAGQIEILRLGESRWSSCTEQQSQLGVEFDLAPPARTLTLDAGEVLLLYHSTRPEGSPDVVGAVAAGVVRSAPRISIARLAELLRSALPQVQLGLVIRNSTR